MAFKIGVKTVFEPTVIGGLPARNRIIRAAVADRSNGAVTGEIIEKYRRLAASGVGVIITGFVTVEERESFIPTVAFFDDSRLPRHQDLVNAVHQQGGKIVLQIASVGSYVIGGDCQGVPIYAPSAVQHLASQVRPQEMSLEEIRQVRQCFVNAAIRGKSAGYDGIEIHGAHNFLLSLFASPYYNRRTDAYGGSVENRARMLLETVGAVKKAVGGDCPIWVKLNSDEHIDNGITGDEFLYQCEELDKLGVAAIEVSGNWSTIASRTGPYYLDAARRAADLLEADVILTGGLRKAAEMLDILKSSKIVAFGMARPFIKNPDFMAALLSQAK
jgi:2,4-dienoyl-CoA reductase-like NADH-dependent reductase (Old Yellow Enzyme family)